MLNKPLDVSAKVNKTVRLSNTPGLEEVDQFLAQVMETGGKGVDVSWFTPDKKVEFILNVKAHARGAEPEWNLAQNLEGMITPLWTYVSCDMLLIHNLILTTCGEAHKSVAGEGKIIKTTDAYKGIYRMPSSYSTAAIDLIDQGTKPVAPGEKVAKTPKVLSGDLSLIDMTNLLNSVSMSKLTGRLSIKTPTDEAEVYFENGTPVHARCREGSGDECIMVLCGWEEGQFNFDLDVASDKKSIRESLDKLLLKGVLLFDKQKFLLNYGITTDCVLLRNKQDLAEKEFESISSAASSGSFLSYDMTLQKHFYLNINNKSTVGELVQKMNLLRSQWVPLLVRMLKCDFVIAKKPDVEAKAEALTPKTIDRSAIHSVMTVLKRPETGLLTFPAFLYFLEQEFLRHHRNNKPMSVVVIEMRVSDNSPAGTHQPLPPRILGEVVRRLSKLKRDVDYLGHYEMFDFAAILPDTKADGAYIFTERVMAALFGDPLDTFFDNNQMTVSMGIASVPDDSKDLPTLLSAAEAARRRAQRTGRHAVAFSEIRQNFEAKS